MKISSARRALDDCRYSLEWFRKEPVAEDFRLTLILCATMLRIVGHLIKKECDFNDDLKTINYSLWEVRKKDPLFSHFIDLFRNNLLKEYKSPVMFSSITQYGTNAHRMEYLITDGMYKDTDVRDLIAQSIEWWNAYIEELEAKAEPVEHVLTSNC